MKIIMDPREFEAAVVVALKVNEMVGGYDLTKVEMPNAYSSNQEVVLHFKERADANA